MSSKAGRRGARALAAVVVGTVVFAVVGAVGACGSTNPSPSPGSDGGAQLQCDDKGLVHSLPSDWHHTMTCTESCGNGMVPPTGGPHCPTWLNCRVYDQEQPMCNWIHNLEHGHAVLLYNCPQGCPEIVDGLKGLWDEAGAGGKARRILVTPWPGLDTKVAAVVAGFSWKGDTFDADAIRCVLSHQDAEAPEAGLGCSP